MPTWQPSGLFPTLFCSYKRKEFVYLTTQAPQNTLINAFGYSRTDLLGYSTCQMLFWIIFASAGSPSTCCRGSPPMWTMLWHCRSIIIMVSCTWHQRDLGKGGQWQHMDEHTMYVHHCHSWCHLSISFKTFEKESNDFKLCKNLFAHLNILGCL